MAGDPSVYHAPIIYVSMYLYLPSTCLSSVYHPFIICFPSPSYISIAHLFPYRLSIYRSLICFPVARLCIDCSSISLLPGYISIAHLFLIACYMSIAHLLPCRPAVRRSLMLSACSPSLGCTPIPRAICVFPAAQLYADPSWYLCVSVSLSPPAALTAAFLAPLF